MPASPLQFKVVGTDSMLAKLRKLKGVGPFALGMALREVGEEIIGYAQEKTVPRDTSTLAGSGYVEAPIISSAGAMVRLGFGGAAAKYAYAVHFNPRAGKTGGISPSGRKYKHWAKTGGWKYMEKALARYQTLVPRRVGAIITREWGWALH